MDMDDMKFEAQNAMPQAAVAPTYVAMAISGSKKSKHIIKWALENLLSQGQGDICFKLLHVYPAITTVPTPLGTSIPISQVRDDVATAFRKEVEWQTNEKILPYKMLFLKRKLQIDIVKIEADDVAAAIIKQVAKCNIKKLVIGSSSSGMFSRGLNWSSKISEGTPTFCTVYVVSKGKLSSVRPGDPGINGNLREDHSDASRTTNSSSQSDSSQTERSDQGPSTSPLNRFQVLSAINQTIQSILDKKTYFNETAQQKTLSQDTDTPEGKGGARANARMTEFTVANSHSSKLQAPSQSRTKRRPTTLTTDQIPHRKSTSSRNTHTSHIFPYGEGGDDANTDPVNREQTSADHASYPHFQTSPPSHKFQAVASKNQTPDQKSTYSGLKRSRKIFGRTREGKEEALGSIADDGGASETLYSHSQSPSPPTDKFQSLSLMDETLQRGSTMSNEICDSNTSHNDNLAKKDDVVAHSSNIGSSDVTNQVLSVRSFETENSPMLWTHDQISTSSGAPNFSSGSQVAINFELERLRLELRHMQGLYNIAQTEAHDASRKKRRLEEEIKLKVITIKEEVAKGLAKQEKEKCEAAKREANYAKECAEKEVARRKQAEFIALREVKGKEMLENALVNQVHQYQIFSYEEILAATESFSEIHRIGMGSYGTVYKCSLRHTNAAVKVFHSMSTNKMKQFRQELEVLSKIRHQHLLTLLGACPERGCLVYEYMEKGSLEERLLTRNNTPPLPWFERYRIAQEVASALVFLHSSKPEPIIHRDLKPANILLDENLVSKIGDAGLSTMVQPDSGALHTLYKDTSPVGTLCYIDPEYQRTGQVSPKSDVYALGMVILQLLTAKQAIALTHIVEEAIQDGKLQEILDPEAGGWPLEETKELAVLALKCTEIRRRDRPDLKSEILPTLEKLRVVADGARDSASASNGLTRPQSHFICPLLKDVMNDPCVAADGYTYDRKAIEAWLEKNDSSPVTTSALPHKHLLPNFSLLSAIKEWKSRNQWYN